MQKKKTNTNAEDIELYLWEIHTALTSLKYTVEHLDSIDDLEKISEIADKIQGREL